MLRPSYNQSLKALLPRTRHAVSKHFSISSVINADKPNEVLELDQSFKTLLRDVDISLGKSKAGHPNIPSKHSSIKELEAFPVELTHQEEGQGTDILADWQDEELPEDVDYHAGPREARKSPTAAYGSQGIGQIVLPAELQNSITTLIEGMPLRSFQVLSSLTILSRLQQTAAS